MAASMVPRGTEPPYQASKDDDHVEAELLAEFLQDEGDLTMNDASFDFRVSDAELSLVPPGTIVDGYFAFVSESRDNHHIPSMPQVGAQVLPLSYPSLAIIQAMTNAASLAEIGRFSLLTTQQNASRPVVSPCSAGFMDQAGDFRGVLDDSAHRDAQLGMKALAQRDRRRLRNRVLAKRNRSRRKCFVDSLQHEFEDLREENLKLRKLVRVLVGSNGAEAILDELDADKELPPQVDEPCTTDLDPSDIVLVRSILKSRHTGLKRLPSLPQSTVSIAFASDQFIQIAG